MVARPHQSARPSIGRYGIRLFLTAVTIVALHVGTAAAQPPPFLDKWGTQGSGPGQFDVPFGITSDDSGYIYVTDLNNQRVQKFTGDGAFVKQWGSFGSGDGQFISPTGIAWSPLGEIIVADHSNHRVCRYSTSGEFLGCFGQPGSEPGEFLYPVGIATDPDGTIYVTESENHRVQKFTPQGSFIRTWGSYGSGAGQMVRPYGVVSDGAGHVFVAEHGEHRLLAEEAGELHSVQRFTADGAFELMWGPQGIADGEFNIAEGLALDGNGSLFVCDVENHRIQQFTTDGGFIGKWGTPGAGDGQFNKPTDITFDPAGSIYVVDAFNNRVQKFGTGPAPHREPVLVSVRDVPDDDGGEVFVRWKPSSLDVAGFRSITGYRVWRRLPLEDVVAAAFDRPAAEGTWTHEGRLIRVLTNLDGASQSYWEAIVTVPAERLEGYGVAAATRQDSTRLGNPYTAFFVTALTSDPFVFYQSSIDSGYSVDNRRPRQPRSTTMIISAEGSVIRWQANEETDLGSYRVYRANAPDFDRSATLIAELDDTSYVDRSGVGNSSYAVSAVDVHGNESDFAVIEVEGGILEGSPSISLGPPVPNPAHRVPVTLRYGLPRQAHVTLVVTDLQGRSVRKLRSGLESAGWHDVAWTGADHDGRSVTSGIYFVRLTVDREERMQRVIWME